MAQKKWETLLADRFEGGVSEERALLDIKRGVMENLYHDNVGMYITVPAKKVIALDPLTGIGVVAIDRIRNLTWKNYKPIAKGEDTITPHIGNVDTYQATIDDMMYVSLELPITDLTRMKNEPVYRAQLVASITRTLRATMDCEALELLVAAAAGRKGAVIEMDIPKYDADTKRGNLFSRFSYLGNEIEQTVNANYIGVNRNELTGVSSPDIPAGAVFEGKVLEWVQSNYLNPAKIAGITVITHPFLGINVPKEATNDFGKNYNFKGIKMIINHVAASWMHIVFQDTQTMPNYTTGNMRLIQRAIWGKGLVYGDLVRVIKEPSTKDEPFEFETGLIEHRKVLNSVKYGFKDWDIVIPETIEKLQEGYDRSGLKEVYSL